MEYRPAALSRIQVGPPLGRGCYRKLFCHQTILWIARERPDRAEAPNIGAQYKQKRPSRISRHPANPARDLQAGAAVVIRALPETNLLPSGHDLQVRGHAQVPFAVLFIPQIVLDEFPTSQ